MEAQPATEPKKLEADLGDLAIALCAIDNRHPLLELAEDACSFMVTLMQKDPGHTVDERGYREFYRAVQNIIELFNKTLHNPNPPPIPARFCTLGLIKTKSELKRKFKKASRVSTYKWEQALILSGGVVSAISTIPGLALLKPLGAALGLIGELVQTMHGNKDECAALLDLASRIVGDLSAKMQGQGRNQHSEPTEDMKRHVRAFERTLIRIHDYMVKLDHNSRAKRFRWLVLANTTKDDLAAFRKDLMDAQTVFMTWNVYTTRQEVHHAVQILEDIRVKSDLKDAQLISNVCAARLEVHDVVQLLKHTTIAMSFVFL